MQFSNLSSSLWLDLGLHSSEITRLSYSSEDKDQALMLPRERQSSFHPFIQVLEIQRLKLNPAIKFIAE